MSPPRPHPYGTKKIYRFIYTHFDGSDLGGFMQHECQKATLCHLNYGSIRWSLTSLTRFNLDLEKRRTNEQIISCGKVTSPNSCLTHTTSVMCLRSCNKSSYYFNMVILTFAPIWFPHWPAWICTISLMVKWVAAAKPFVSLTTLMSSKPTALNRSTSRLYIPCKRWAWGSHHLDLWLDDVTPALHPSITGSLSASTALMQ